MSSAAATKFSSTSDEHDPEKWKPVSRLREACFGGRMKVGQDHAQARLADIKGTTMELPLSENRRMKVDEFDSGKMLAHAAKQAKQRNYGQFPIVDVDSHH